MIMLLSVRSGLILCVAILFLGITVTARPWREGWIALKGGDTLRGEVSIRSWNYFRKVRFRKEKGERDTVLTGRKVKAYTYDGRYFKGFDIPESQAGVETYRFGEALVRGRVTLYRTRYLYEGCDCGGGATEEKGYLLVLPEKVFLIRKKRWWDRIANPGTTARAFSSFGSIAEGVREGETGFTELPGKLREALQE